MVPDLGGVQDEVPPGRSVADSACVLGVSKGRVSQLV